MGFAGKWFGVTLVVLTGVLVASVVTGAPEDRTVPFKYTLWDDEPPVATLIPPVKEKLQMEVAAEEEQPRSRRARAQRRVAETKCKEYYDSAKFWRMVKKEYPRDIGEMAAPLREGEDDYQSVEKDPWGNDYYLELDGKKIRIWSWGPDGQEGTGDDIAYPPADR